MHISVGKVTEARLSHRVYRVALRLSAVWCMRCRVLVLLFTML